MAFDDEFDFPDVAPPSPPPPPAVPPITSGLPGYRDEWKYWPNLEPITLRVAAKAGYTDSAVQYAKRRALQFKELAASGGVYTARDLVWLVPTELLASGVTIKPADVVKDGGNENWTVLEVNPLGKFGNTWRLVTRNLVLAADLRDSATVYRPSAAVDAAGQRAPVFSSVYSAVPCRLQEQQQAALDDYQGGPTGRREFTLWVGQRLALKAGDVIEIDGTRYDFSGSANWDRIDQLGEVRVYKAGE